MTEKLILKNAVIKYGENIIIKNISLTINSGELVFITGANGSGKSTLTRGIAGLLPLSSGEIIRTEKLSYVPQIEEADRNFPASVKEIILTGTQRKGHLFYSHNDKINLENAMNELNIISLADKKINTLSGGQMRRVLLARALIGEPELLLLDEPCAGLDEASHELLFDILRKKLDSGCSVIMVTHDNSDLEGIKASRIITLSDGRIKYQS